MINARKTVLGAFAAGAAVVALSSSAYGCVVFRGDLTVTGPVSGNKVTGDGSNTSHKYCATREPVTAAEGGYNDAITVTVASGSLCNASGTNKLADGNNSVIINNSSTDSGVPFKYSGGKWNFVSGTGCFASPPGNKTLTTSFNVVAGAATAPFVLPHMNRVDPANMASALCVGKSGVSGIFAPIRITSI